MHSVLLNMKLSFDLFWYFLVPYFKLVRLEMCWTFTMGLVILIIYLFIYLLVEYGLQQLMLLHHFWSALFLLILSIVGFYFSQCLYIWVGMLIATTHMVSLQVFLSNPVPKLILKFSYMMQNRALSYILAIAAKDMKNTRPEIDIFIIRTLIAYQSLPDPMAYKNDHPQIIQLCTTPFR